MEIVKGIVKKYPWIFIGTLSESKTQAKNMFLVNAIRVYLNHKNF